MGISGSNHRNERVMLLSGEQVILHRPQGPDSRFLIKERDGKVVREVLASQLGALSIKGMGQIYTDQRLKDSQGHQDLIFLADDQTSICRTQGLGVYASTSKTIATYEGKIFHFVKDPKGRFIVLTEDGLLESASIENSSIDIQNDSGLSLAATGLFADVSRLQPHEFFLQYYSSVNSGIHGENSRCFAAFPKGEKIMDLGRQGWLFPEGTIFLHIPSAENPRPSNKQAHSEAIRILIKSQGQWRYYVYPTEFVSSSETVSEDEQLGSESIRQPGAIAASDTQNCWVCHSKTFNDRIQSFHDTVFNQVSPSGIMQTEFLRQVGLLTRERNPVEGLVPNPPTKASTQLLSEIASIVSRIQALATSWYGKQLRFPASPVPPGTAFSEDERLLALDAFKVTGDEKYRRLIIADGLPEHIQDNLSEWLSSVNIAEFDNSFDEGTHQDLLRINHLVTLMLTFPEAQRIAVHRLFAKAALVFMDVRKSSASYAVAPSSSDILSSADIRRYSTLRPFDVVWIDSLLEYYGITGAPWAFQEAKKFLGVSIIPMDDNFVVQFDRAIILRHCLLSLRAYELTGDSDYLKKSLDIWECFLLLAPTLDESLEERVLAAHCVLRFLFLDLDVAASDECLDVLAGFESILNSPELSDSQKISSVETSIAKLTISKALVDSKLINPELWMLRRARKDR
jgi:hypothetical protein